LPRRSTASSRSKAGEPATTLVCQL
jgi:hypothetical protein